MKLQIYFRPEIVVLLMTFAACLLCWAALGQGWTGWLALPFAAFYALLAAACLWA